MPNKPSKSIRVAAILTALLFLYFLNFIPFFQRIFSAALSPIQIQMNDTTNNIKNYLQMWSKRNELEKENEDLKLANQKLLAENSELKLLTKENDILKKELGFLEDKKYNYLAGKVIGASYGTFSNALIFNRGEKDGMQNGLAVATDNGIMVGKIVKTNDDSSVFLLITDNNSKVAGSIVNADNSIGVVRGDHGLGIQMDLIPQNEKVDIGNIVITSGLENNIPQGLIIGQIENIISSKTELFQSVSIKSLISFDKLSSVFAILPPK